MSNSDAIAAVTATLIDLLGDVSDIGGSEASAYPPDKASDGLQEGQGRVNIFLYQTSVNTAWSNMDLPHQIKPGERGFPPLALNLHYLLTTHTGDHNPILSQRLLGRAMSILHDNAVLSRERIAQVTPNGDVHKQIESVRITPQPLSVDEISKLWTIFQTQYRTSAAYQASVVLIDSGRPVSTPLPVLRRGREDRGVISQPHLIPSLPTITDIELPDNQPGLEFRAEVTDTGQIVIRGDELTLHGHHLSGDQVQVQFIHPRLADAIHASPQPGSTGTAVRVKLSKTPGAQSTYPAGIYRLAVVVATTEEEGPVTRVSNQLACPLAPRLMIPDNPIVNDILTLRCMPQVWPEQRVVALLGSSEVAAQSHPGKTDTVTFNVKDVSSGKHLVRLRVDGVDSLMVEDYTARPLVFDEKQMVSIP